MKTDVIEVSSAGTQIGKTLEQVEKVAAYKSLSPKDALCLRLLTEEMMGMMRSITGEKKGEFWIEDSDGEYRLHLRVNTWMNPDKREQLLAASTSGKNEAARGLMGRLRDFFEQGADTPGMPLYYADGMGDTSTAALDWEWSMTAYQRQLQEWSSSDDKAREMWDELEKSVVTHVADEIKVSIKGDWVEMTIHKKLG